MAAVSRPEFARISAYLDGVLSEEFNLSYHIRDLYGW